MRASTTDFVGRERELALAVRALTEPPALVLIEGEPGIGKTRLVRECLGSTELRERRVLVAACPPLVEPFPLGPLVDGLRRFGDEVRAARLSPLAGAIRPVFPEWADDLPPAPEPLDDPRATRHRLLRALIELIERLGVDVIVVEDAHWADAATLELLLTLVAVPASTTSLVVTYRPTDVLAGSLLRRLTSRTHDGLSRLRIELAPFDLDEVGRLIASMLACSEVSAPFAALLHERTAGIPLALEECLLSLQEQQEVASRGGTWARRALEDMQVPPTVRDSVLERLERLPTPARRVVEAASVLGEPADIRLLAAVAGLDDGPAAYGMAAALAAIALREVREGQYAVRHALAAKAVEEALPASDRRRLHARAAEALLDDPHPSVVRLARHYRQAGDLDAWARYAEASADLALASGDDRTAATLLVEILTERRQPAEDRRRVARKLGDATQYGATPLGTALSSRIVEALREVLDDPSLPTSERGLLRLLLALGLRELTQEEAASAEAEAAFASLGDHPNEALVAAAILAYPLVPGRPAAWHLKWLERAGELLPRVGAKADRIRFRWRRVTTLLLLGEEEGWAADAQLAGPGVDRPEQRYTIEGSLNVAQLEILWGRYADARERLDAALDMMLSTGLQSSLHTARVAAGYLDWYTGEWAAAEQAAVAVLESESARRLDQLQARQLLGLVRLASGAHDAGRRLLGPVWDEFGSLGAIDPTAVIAPAALARLHVTEGAAHAALCATGPAVDMIAAKTVWLWATDVAPVHADALVAAGRLDEVRALVERLRSWLRERDVPAASAALRTCEGILAAAGGQQRRAAQSFADAVAAWAALPRPYDEALARERVGGCLLAAGDVTDAVCELSRAEVRLRGLGARWDADRIAQLLRRHGVAVARPWRRGRRGYGEQLSPRELEVVRLVAQGLTNRQIAETLFLSPRTVDRHLSAARQKLGVSSRTALAMTAAEAGLLRA